MNSKALLLILVLGVIGAAAFFTLPRLEANPPSISGPSEIVLGRAPGEFEFALEDPDAGLRTVQVLLPSVTGPKTLLTREFPGSVLTGGEVRSEIITLRLDAKELGLADGPTTLTLIAQDWSLRGALAGNRVEESIPLIVDTVAPKVSALSGLTYIQRGGSGVVVYQVGADATRHGVRVADTFFQGYPSPDPESDLRVAIFAVPVDAPADPAIRVVASDAAGNERASIFPARLLEREFATRNLELPKNFLEQRVIPLAEANGFDTADVTQAFRDVNETLRQRNEARIREALGDDPAVRRFQGVFAQMSNSQVTSRFAEKRHYILDANEISRAVHFGFDLASTAGAPVTAANAGVVAIAEDVGIYGNCVILDHGLGVRTLYGHLSELAVDLGDTVEKGAVLGRSGMTGLAGGDHLHFAILVGSVYVDPLEWWDAKWVRTHVDERLANRE